MFGWLKKSASNTKVLGEKLIGTDNIKDAAKDIKGMAQSVLSPKEQIKNSKKESFKDAMSRLGVNESQLIQNYINFTYICYASLTFAVLCFANILYQLFVNHALFAAVPGLAIFAFCLINAFKYSFRAFQIKHQKLCSVKEWWNRSDEWIPKLKG